MSKRNKGKSNYSRESWINKCANVTSMVYVIRCYNDTESFYKIGITSKTVRERFGPPHGITLPYNYEIIVERSFRHPGRTWDLEKELFELNKDLKYSPELDFNGKTECFKGDVDLSPLGLGTAVKERSDYFEEELKEPSRSAPSECPLSHVFLVKIINYRPWFFRNRHLVEAVDLQGLRYRRFFRTLKQASAVHDELRKMRGR